jgi:ubiquinone/menaquinone biosynthesis C-methylase UbiE
VDLRILSAAYDRSAAGYDERFRKLQREKFRAAAPWLLPDPGAFCLDAGGGTGLLVEWAREEAPSIAQARWLVADVSLGMLRHAEGRGARIAADIRALPFAEAAFTVVCAFTSVLMEAPLALDELARCVAHRGRLAVSFLREQSPRSLRVRGLRVEAGPVPAGQDELFVLRKE